MLRGDNFGKLLVQVSLDPTLGAARPRRPLNAHSGQEPDSARSAVFERCSGDHSKCGRPLPLSKLVTTRKGYPIVGITNSAPARIPVCHLVVIVFNLV